MTALLDTHAVIWALTNDPQLSPQARMILSDLNHIIVVSTVSLWEIAVKNQKAPHLCPYHEKEILDYCLKAGYLVADMKPNHVLALRSLQVKPDRIISNHDPFDRLLLAQAKAEGWTFLSHDRSFDNYDESCILKI